MDVRRRDFLYVLAVGTAAVAGWVLLPRRPSAPPAPTDNPFHPQIAREFRVRQTTSGGEILRPDGRGGEHVVCQVNACGFTIVEHLDGKHTLDEIARGIHGGHAAEDLGHTTASVASFLATLAQAGILSEPFFVNLESAEVSV